METVNHGVYYYSTTYVNILHVCSSKEMLVNVTFTSSQPNMHIPPRL